MRIVKSHSVSPDAPMSLDAPTPAARPGSLSPLVPLLALALIDLGAPFLPVPSLMAAKVGGAVLTVMYVAAIVAYGLSVARRELSIPVALGWLALCVFAWFGVEKAFWPMLREFGRIANEVGAEPTFWQQFTFLYVKTLQDLALISGALFSGALLARGIRYPNMLGPIGAIIAIIDIWGVLFGGIVSQMLENKATQPIAARVMASGPQIGAYHAGATGFSIDVPSVGVGDFLFIALLLCALVNLKMNWRMASWLMWAFVSFALCSIALQLRVPVPVGFPPQHIAWMPVGNLPGLLFIGAGAVLPNFKFFTFTRDERFALLWAGLLVLVLTVALYIGFKIALPPQPASATSPGPRPVPRAASRLPQS